MSPILTLDGITKRFGGLKALDNVSFTIDRGEIVGLIGPNGAGKTTLFNNITGFSTPDSGSILFNEETELVGLDPDEVCRLGISRCFQISELHKGLSVFENVLSGALFGKNENVGMDEAEGKTWEVLEFVGLDEKADEMAKNLPVRDEKLLDFAKALATEPELILMDETMAGMTKEEIEDIKEIIWRINDDGKTVFIIGHTVEAIASVSERIIVILSGEKIAEGPAEEVVKEEIVKKAYFGTA